MRDPDGPTAALGRYSPEGDGSPLVEVRLLGLPLRLLRSSREHHDDLVRELRLLAMSGEMPSHEPPARLLEIVTVLGERYGASRERQDAELDAALDAGLEVVDQVERVPPAAAQAAAGLHQMLLDADGYCERALLLTVPRPPEVRQFAGWYIAQLVDQVAGAAPVRWDGPLQVGG